MKRKINDLVTVERTARLRFPGWVQNIQHQELEHSGPMSFHLRELEQHTIPQQLSNGNGWLRGYTIYVHHLSNHLLEQDLGLRELMAIQAKGPAFYGAHLRDKTVVGWKSVVIDQAQDHYAPFIQKRAGVGIILDWCWLGNAHFYPFTVSLRFKPEQMPAR